MEGEVSAIGPESIRHERPWSRRAAEIAAWRRISIEQADYQAWEQWMRQHPLIREWVKRFPGEASLAAQLTQNYCSNVLHEIMCELADGDAK